MNENMKKAPDFREDNHLNIETKEYLQILNAGDTPVESLPVPDARKVLTDAQAGSKVNLNGIYETEKTIRTDNFTIKLNIVKPRGVLEKLPVFVFLHGGGWVLGDYPTHQRLVRDLVVASGITSVFINYTPSPEAKYPQPLDEIYEAVKWIYKNGEDITVDGNRMAIVGNSVGGNMAIATALRAKEEGEVKIKFQGLLWPVTDTTFEWNSYLKYGEQRFLTTSLMKWMFDQYTTDESARKEIYISPLQASKEQLQSLPPTLIAVAENDILRDQGEALGRKMNEAGVDVTTIRFNGVIHDWGMLNGYAEIPETKAVIDITAAMLKRFLRED